MGDEWAGLPYGGLSQPLREERRRRARWAYWLMASAVVFQGIHVAEHVIQLHQWALGDPHAHGILGAQFNFVWFHFLSNVFLWALVLGAYLLWRGDRSIWRDHTTGTRTFHMLIALQTYHVGEHTVQMVQRYAYGIMEPPGLIGYVLPRIIAHFDLNVMVFVMVVIVYACFKPTRDPYVGRRAVGYAATA